MTDTPPPTQDRLTEIEAILEENTWLAIGEAEWLIEEVKRLRLPDDLAEEMRSAAREDARSLNAEIKIALRWWLIARRKKR